MFKIFTETERLVQTGITYTRENFQRIKYELSKGEYAADLGEKDVVIRRASSRGIC